MHYIWDKEVELLIYCLSLTMEAEHWNWGLSFRSFSIVRKHLIQWWASSLCLHWVIWKFVLWAESDQFCKRYGWTITSIKILKKDVSSLQFTFETWKFMMEKDVRLSGKCYFFAIKALCKGGYLDEVYTNCALQLLSFFHPLVVFCFIRNRVISCTLPFERS